VFINDRLALDLGGIHTKETGEIDVDAQATAVGLELGQVYALDTFQAERHTSESNFRIDTTLEFTNCGVIVPDVPK
jgi:fibro-slime domain-containing protein